MSFAYDYESDIQRAALPEKIKEEFRQLFAKRIKAAQSTTRRSKAPLSFRTQRLRSLVLTAGIADLVKIGGFLINSLNNLKGKHIEWLVQYWVTQKLTRGTIANKITYFQTLAEWLGKGNIVHPMAHYDALQSLPPRSGVALTDKSWETHNVDAEQMISRIARDNPHVAIQLALQITFGLRTEESMLLRPNDALMKRSGEHYLMISDGTKGGRPRRVEVSNIDDLRVLDLAKTLINQKSKTTIPDEVHSLNEWKNQYYYLLKKHGLTKKELGVTAHGLRHQYMNTLYEELTGQDSAVRGGTAPPRDILQSAHSWLSSLATCNTFAAAIQR